jgi:hypothetical protein
MKKMFFAIPLILMGILFASTAMSHDSAHDEGKGGHGIYEEGSGGSAMEMDGKSRTMAHEYKGEHGGDHSKEYYENKYGNYEHEKNHIKEEGSSMKDEAMQMKEMEHKRMDEGSKM